MITPQFLLPLHGELVIDLFAGGGGASTGIEQAIGRPVDVAINHDPEAVALHQANHPQTQHFVSDVFEVDPMAVLESLGWRKVGLLWASPDCKHFSKAKGGKPVSKKIRSLAWVVVKWAKAVRPRMICLENVEEFQTWGPLDKETNMPCPRRKGRTFARWKAALQALGYQVEHRELRACDYGAPTIRKRLFLVARCDGQPIVWPEATHGAPDSLGVKARKLKAWATAAECIDWSIPAPSIFERTRPLADATCRRIAKGIMRYVVDAAEPFIVGVGGRAGQSPERPLSKPMGTITSKGDAALTVPTIISMGHGERPGQQPRVPGVERPHSTITAQGQHSALVTAFLAKHFTGVVGSDLRRPMSTVTTIDHHSLATCSMEVMDGGVRGFQGVAGSWSAGAACRRDHLEAGNSRQHAADLSDHAKACGEFIETRLPHGQDVDGGATVPRRGSRRGVPDLGRPNPGGNGRQPQGRHQVEQSPGQHGVDHQVRESSPCLPNRAAHSLASDPGAGDTENRASSQGSTSEGPQLQPDRQGPECRSNDGIQRRAEKVWAFLTTYYGTDQDPALREPLHTITTKDRFGIVTVKGQPYAIVDIGLRMLTPRELYRAQGFPESYQIDRGADGRPLTKTAQVRMCGNSVCPPLARALVAANYVEAAAQRRVA